MAKKKKVTTKPAQKSEYTTAQKIRFARKLTGILVIMFAIYLLVSIISYIGYWNPAEIARGTSLATQNFGGSVGHALATQALSHWFGYPALLLPVILLLVGIIIYKKTTSKKVYKVTVFLILWMLVLSGLFGLLSSATLSGTGWGGGHGYAVGSGLRKTVGVIGGFLVLFIGLTLLFRFSFPKLWRLLINKLFTAHKNTRPTTVADKASEIPVMAASGTMKDEYESTDYTGEPVTVTPPIQKPAEIVLSEIPGEIPLIIEEHKEEQIPLQEQLKTPVEENRPDSTDKIPQLEQPYDPKADLSHYQYPPLDLLDSYDQQERAVSKEELKANQDKIIETLGHYNIPIDHIKANIGPTVTLYEIIPKPGIRISKIKNLENDIALSLAALGIRIIAPIPGKGTIGIEVPNLNPEMVPLLSVLRSNEFQNSKFSLPIALGKTITNKTFILDLAQMPHLLLAGATGQGKSVGLNAIITSLLFKKHPSELKLVMIDPKKVELPLYAKIENHFLAKLPDAEEPIITDTQKVVHTLTSLCNLMDTRYNLLKNAAVRNIKEYNTKFIQRQLNPMHGHHYMPYIVLVIDEFADLIMTSGREIETPIARLAQLGRATGFHLIIATQRPTTNIITGLIKANFPSRIAFRVTSMIDSRTILDQPGAQQLIGKGDMLVSGGSDMVRVQCAFVDLHEVERIANFIGNQQSYGTAYMLPEYVGESGESIAEKVDLQKRDPLFNDAARLIVEYQQGSTSVIQRKMELGYNRAGRIMDQLEAAGIVGPAAGSKPRQVLIYDLRTLEEKLQAL